VTSLLRRVLASSRFFIAIAVVGSFVASAAALVYGGVATVMLVIGAFGRREFSAAGAKHLAVDLVGMIDLFLLGTVLYIVAAGLYQLFVDPDLPLPRWLQVATLDDLKERLLGVVIVLLAVTFLGDVVEWDGDWNLLAEGLSVALVLGVLALTIAVLTRAHPAGGSGGHRAPGTHGVPEAPGPPGIPGIPETPDAPSPAPPGGT
jgi:uncharacterized membrane protein YqhA